MSFSGPPKDPASSPADVRYRGPSPRNVTDLSHTFSIDTELANSNRPRSGSPGVRLCAILSFRPAKRRQKGFVLLIVLPHLTPEWFVFLVNVSVKGRGPFAAHSYTAPFQTSSLSLPTSDHFSVFPIDGSSETRLVGARIFLYAFEPYIISAETAGGTSESWSGGSF